MITTTVQFQMFTDMEKNEITPEEVERMRKQAAKRIDRESQKKHIGPDPRVDKSRTR